MSSDCFWKVASALGSDGGTQSHQKKGAASSGRNSLLGKCGHLVSAKQRWDIGDAKLRAEGLAPEREVSADGAVGKAELGFPISALQIIGGFSVMTVLGVHSFQEMKAL